MKKVLKPGNCIDCGKKADVGLFCDDCRQKLQNLDFKDQSAIIAEMGLPTDPFLQGIMDHKIPEWAK